MADTTRAARDHERPPAQPLERPIARPGSAPVIRPQFVQSNRRPTRNVPYEDTDLVSMAQNTIVLAGGAVMTFVHPEKYANPSFTCSILNIGPGMISCRWDGMNAVFGDPECVLIPAGMGYAEASTVRFSIAADGTGATVSMSCEMNFG